MASREMLKIPTIGHYDAVTKTSDVNYQYIEKMYTPGDAKDRAFFDADNEKIRIHFFIAGG